MQGQSRSAKLSLLINCVSRKKKTLLETWLRPLSFVMSIYFTEFLWQDHLCTTHKETIDQLHQKCLYCVIFFSWDNNQCKKVKFWSATWAFIYFSTIANNYLLRSKSFFCTLVTQFFNASFIIIIFCLLFRIRHHILWTTVVYFVLTQVSRDTR